MFPYERVNVLEKNSRVHTDWLQLAGTVGAWQDCLLVHVNKLIRDQLQVAVLWKC